MPVLTFGIYLDIITILLESEVVKGCLKIIIVAPTKSSWFLRVQNILDSLGISYLVYEDVFSATAEILLKKHNTNFAVVLSLNKSSENIQLINLCKKNNIQFCIIENNDMTGFIQTLQDNGEYIDNQVVTQNEIEALFNPDFLKNA